MSEPALSMQRSWQSWGRGGQRPGSRTEFPRADLRSGFSLQVEAWCVGVVAGFRGMGILAGRA